MPIRKNTIPDPDERPLKRCPIDLSPEEQVVWRKVKQLNPNLKAGDEETLRVYCALRVASEKEMTASAANTLMKLLEALGCTAASRRRLSTGETTKKKEAGDEFFD